MKVGPAIGIETRKAAECFDGPFMPSQISDLIIPLFPKIPEQFVKMVVIRALANYRQRGRVETVKAGTPKVQGIYRWKAKAK